MKTASADLIALLAGTNQVVMWDTYTITLSDGSVLTWSTGAPATPGLPLLLGYWNGTTLAGSGAVVAINTTYELCLSYDGTTLYGFVNGVLQFSTPRAFDFGSARPLTIGANWINSSDARFSGKLDELRVTKGVCRHISDYSPTVGAYPRGGGDASWSSVTLLMGFNNTGTPTAFADESSLGQTVVGAGTAVISAAAPLVGAGSLSLDGAGRLTIASNAGFGFSTGPWTWEARTSIPAAVAGPIFDFRTSQYQDGAMYLTTQ